MLKAGSRIRIKTKFKAGDRRGSSRKQLWIKVGPRFTLTRYNKIRWLDVTITYQSNGCQLQILRLFAISFRCPFLAALMPPTKIYCPVGFMASLSNMYTIEWPRTCTLICRACNFFLLSSSWSSYQSVGWTGSTFHERKIGMRINRGRQSLADEEQIERNLKVCCCCLCCRNTLMCNSGLLLVTDPVIIQQKYAHSIIMWLSVMEESIVISWVEPILSEWPIRSGKCHNWKRDTLWCRVIISFSLAQFDCRTMCWARTDGPVEDEYEERLCGWVEKLGN